MGEVVMISNMVLEDKIQSNGERGRLRGRLYLLMRKNVGTCVCAKSLQSCPTLCDPVDCSPTGSSVHGILQARILERVAMPFPRESSPPRDQTWVS